MSEEINKKVINLFSTGKKNKLTKDEQKQIKYYAGFSYVKVKKDDFIGIFEKDIVVDNPNKLETLMTLLEKMIDEDSSIITILVGQDVNDEEMNQVSEMISEKFSDLDLDIRKGDQPVYFFLIGVE